MKRKNFSSFKNRVHNFRSYMKNKSSFRRKGGSSSSHGHPIHKIHRGAKWLLPLILVLAGFIAIFEYFSKAHKKSA